ncbi:ankyrin repeat domain-containing protein [Rudaea sp.]
MGYLLKHKAQVNSYDDRGYTPLISAIRSGYVAVATYLGQGQDHSGTAG